MNDWVQVEPSGLILPEAVARNRSMPVGIDLFAGCGGFSCGMVAGGFHVAAAAENDVWATITYLHNLGEYPVQMHYVEAGDEERLNNAIERLVKRSAKRSRIVKMPTSGSGWISKQNVPGCQHFFFGDITKLTGNDFLDALNMEQGDVSCVVGGPPCQGFSRANKNRGKDDPRNNLVFEFVRLVCEIQPKTMIMENVPELAKMTTPDGVPMLDELAYILERGGMGSRDTLRNMLAGTAGRGAAFFNRFAARHQEKKHASRHHDDRQADMFQEEAVS